MSNELNILRDRCGRRIEYLRLSVTDRCDLRCAYCLPRGFRDFVQPSGWLTFGEIERLVSSFADLGVSRVRLTGGEPLLRRDLPELATRLSLIPGIADLSLSTNGTLLVRHAAALHRAGVSRLNVSLDTLNRQRMCAISGRDALPEVLRGLMAAREQGFAPIKINMVPLAGINEDEVDAMAEFCMQNGFVLRLVELMPVGLAARGLRPAALEPIRARLRQRYGLVEGVIPGGGPARYLVTADGRFSVGFITPISQHFCANCNRVRITVDGVLHLCLGEEARVDLRVLLRGGATDEELAATIIRAIRDKPERHDFGNSSRRIVRVMAATGG
ncbi:MAG: GTP 3',8-cyclase MoaA [Betaproteobacteria bacterium]|nr:GTP 3',8-cyclase MoaA [Betaproteobacteria bacterium]